MRRKRKTHKQHIETNKKKATLMCPSLFCVVFSGCETLLRVHGAFMWSLISTWSHSGSDKDASWKKGPTILTDKGLEVKCVARGIIGDYSSTVTAKSSCLVHPYQNV